MKNRNIIALFAHPDDETMLCGGTLALLAREGVQVHYVCATRGEGGEVGEPPVSSREHLGEVRSREMECAVQALDGSSLSFLDYIDPLVGPGEELYPFDVAFEVLVRQIQSRAADTGASAIITHGSNGEYGHPAHLLLHQAALQVVKDKTPEMALYTVQAAYETHPKPRLANKDDPADMVIDVRPLLASKTRAALCHRSQHALFVRRTTEDMGRPVEIEEVVMTMESLHRVRAHAAGLQKDELLDLLEKTGLATRLNPAQ